MLTPNQVKNYELEKTNKNTFSVESVNKFKDEVSRDYNQMFRENGELYKKTLALADKLKAYQEDEANIQKTLLNAQRMASDIVAKAQAEAAEILDDAKRQEAANTIIQDAKAEANEIIANATAESIEAAKNAAKEKEEAESALNETKKELAAFQQKIFDLYNEQLSAIKFKIERHIEDSEKTVFEEPVLDNVDSDISDQFEATAFVKTEENTDNIEEDNEEGENMSIKDTLSDEEASRLTELEEQLSKETGFKFHEDFDIGSIPDVLEETEDDTDIEDVL